MMHVHQTRGLRQRLRLLVIHGAPQLGPLRTRSVQGQMRPSGAKGSLELGVQDLDVSLLSG